MFPLGQGVVSCNVTLLGWTVSVETNLLSCFSNKPIRGSYTMLNFFSISVNKSPTKFVGSDNQFGRILA